MALYLQKQTEKDAPLTDINKTKSRENNQLKNKMKTKPKLRRQNPSKKNLTNIQNK